MVKACWGHLLQWIDNGWLKKKEKRKQSRLFCFHRIGLACDDNDVMIQPHCTWAPKYPENPNRLKIPFQRCQEYGLIDRCKRLKVMLPSFVVFMGVIVCMLYVFLCFPTQDSFYTVLRTIGYRTLSKFIIYLLLLLLLLLLSA